VILSYREIQTQQSGPLYLTGTLLQVQPTPGLVHKIKKPSEDQQGRLAL